MTDAFSELVMPIYHRVIDLQSSLSWGESPSLDQVKKQTRGWIEAAEQRASVDATLSAEYHLARYGLVAWIDEVLTASTWGQSVDWGSEDHVLEWDLYRTNLRAERFYQEAEVAYDAASQGRCSADPVEAYLLCVALGFRGELGHDEDRFGDWTERFYAKVSEGNPLSSKPFPDEPSDTPGGALEARRGPGLLLAVSGLFAVTAVTTLAGYIAAVYFDVSRL